uniref:Uncharacterized protein n=1 Tax=Populus trichocarpa TaxID=3694 RepID=B9P636_POPTR
MGPMGPVNHYSSKATYLLGSTIQDNLIYSCIFGHEKNSLTNIMEVAAVCYMAGTIKNPIQTSKSQTLKVSF